MRGYSLFCLLPGARDDLAAWQALYLPYITGFVILSDELPNPIFGRPVIGPEKTILIPGICREARLQTIASVARHIKASSKHRNIEPATNMIRVDGGLTCAHICFVRCDCFLFAPKRASQTALCAPPTTRKHWRTPVAHAWEAGSRCCWRSSLG